MNPTQNAVVDEDGRYAVGQSCVTLLVVGAGSRGNAYAGYSLIDPERSRVIGVAEPDGRSRNRLVESFSIPAGNVFSDWREAVRRPRFADAVLICTQDAHHEEPTIAFAKKGYAILLEKPMAPDVDSCRRIIAAVEESGVIFAVCHVMRYTCYTQKLKALLDDGVIGKIVTIQHMEPVGYWHQAHAYVRGKWSHEAQSSSMLLAKSCHDIDWLRYIVGSPCRRVSSFGSLRHFRREEKPEGAADRCLDCSLARTCPYSAQHVYQERLRRKETGWPTNVVDPLMTEASLLEALKTGPYGRCVYACDNDVVDHQVVNLEYQNGVTASFTMTAFTPHQGRWTRICGTRGFLETDSSTIRIYDFMTDGWRTMETHAGDASLVGGHGGGDGMLFNAFVAAVATGDRSSILSGPNETLESHATVFAAEAARKSGQVVDVRPMDASAVAMPFSGLLPEPERNSPFPERQQKQNDVLLAPSDALTPFGILRTVSSSEIADSGVSIGFECLDRDIFDPTRCYDLLAAAGVKHARCQTGWCKCEKRKGVYDFAWLDAIVDSLLSRGVNPWFNLGYGNKLYMPEAYGEAAVGHVPLYYGDETLEAWKRYVAAIASHFSGRVTHWEIWNEPELREFWQPSEPSYREYARLIETTAPLIRKNCRSARIGACSHAVRHPYVVDLIKLGIARHIDFYSVHAYKVVPEIGFVEAMAEYRALLDAHGGKQVQLWQGESGFASHFPPNHFLKPTVLDSERNQAKWLLRRFLTDRRAGCARTSYFQMVDMIQKPYQMGNVTRTDPARHGILHGQTYRPKPSYHALANYCAVFDDHAEFLGSTGIQGRFPEIPASEADAARVVADTLVGDVYRRDGFPLYLYYLPEDVQKAYPGARGLALTCPAVPASRRIEHPVLVDFLLGRVFALNPVRTNEDGSYCFDDLPLTDHPLMITDADAIPWVSLEAARAGK